MKVSFIVIVSGYFGRGSNIAEAAKQCLKAGARKMNKAAVHIFYGDEKPEFDGTYFKYEPGTQRINLGYGFRLGQLLTLKFL